MRNLMKPSIGLPALLLVSFALGSAQAQQRGQQAQQNQNAAAQQIEILPIRGNVYMLAGAGGNIVSTWPAISPDKRRSPCAAGCGRPCTHLGL